MRPTGRSRATLALIAEKIAAGQDITLDVYSCTTSSTSPHSVLPLFAQAGGFPNMLRGIANADVRERIRRVFVTEPDGGENVVRAAGWTGLRGARAPGQEWAHGLTPQDVAGRLGGDGLDALFEDPGAVGDGAIFDEPLDESAGVLAVFVNGSLAVDDGRFTGAHAGRFPSAGDEGAMTGTSR